MCIAAAVLARVARGSSGGAAGAVLRRDQVRMVTDAPPQLDGPAKEKIASLSRALVGGGKDQDRSVRLDAAHALGQIGDKEAIGALSRALVGGEKDEDADVREAAATALGRIGGTEARVALTRAQLQDGDANVREAATTALGSIGVAEARGPDDPEAAQPDGLFGALYGKIKSVCGGGKKNALADCQVADNALRRKIVESRSEVDSHALTDEIAALRAKLAEKEALRHIAYMAQVMHKKGAARVRVETSAKERFLAVAKDVVDVAMASWRQALEHPPAPQLAADHTERLAERIAEAQAEAIALAAARAQTEVELAGRAAREQYLAEHQSA